MIGFWYAALAVPLLAGIGLAIYRGVFPVDETLAAPTPASSIGSSRRSRVARTFAWFGVGDIDEGLAVTVSLCVCGVVALVLHAIAHVALRSYPAWFGLVALTTGLAFGVAAASLLSRNARGAW